MPQPVPMPSRYWSENGRAEQPGPASWAYRRAGRYFPHHGIGGPPPWLSSWRAVATAPPALLPPAPQRPLGRLTLTGGDDGSQFLIEVNHPDCPGPDLRPGCAPDDRARRHRLLEKGRSEARPAKTRIRWAFGKGSIGVAQREGCGDRWSFRGTRGGSRTALRFTRRFRLVLRHVDLPISQLP